MRSAAIASTDSESLCQTGLVADGLRPTVCLIYRAGGGPSFRENEAGRKRKILPN